MRRHSVIRNRTPALGQFKKRRPAVRCTQLHWSSQHSREGNEHVNRAMDEVSFSAFCLWWGIQRATTQKWHGQQEGTKYFCLVCLPPTSKHSSWIVLFAGLVLVAHIFYPNAETTDLLCVPRGRSLVRQYFLALAPVPRDIHEYFMYPVYLE